MICHLCGDENPIGNIQARVGKRITPMLKFDVCAGCFSEYHRIFSDTIKSTITAIKFAEEQNANSSETTDATDTTSGEDIRVGAAVPEQSPNEEIPAASGI